MHITNLTETQLNEYDHIIVYFSGGKDSLACLLHLVESGVDLGKVELWHHDVDGREGGDLKMDWPVTPAYCQAIADHLEIPLYFSWKVGGFEREMFRNKALTAPTRFEKPDGTVGQSGGVRGKKSTRRKFPQVSGDIKVRWCSAYLKIDVGDTSIRNQKRFYNSRVLTVSGERAEESPRRANYETFEPDRTDNREGRTGRHVDRYRPVHSWNEDKVWAIIERHKINPHPAYHLGWGRVSCRTCIFGSDSQWATVAQIAPQAIEIIADYEKEFDCTIHRSKSVTERVATGEAYKLNGYVGIASSKEYNETVKVSDWALTSGAFVESCGPT